MPMAVFPLLLPLCLAALLLSAATVRLMIGVGVLDRPGHRSSHASPTPKGGGVGPVLALLLLLPVAGWLGAGPAPSRMAALLLPVGMLALVSWLDDVRQYRPMAKLMAQAVAAAILAAVLAPLPSHPEIGFAVGFCWLMFATNALNFIDGLNGLAAGSMALASLFLGLDTPDPLATIAGCLLSAGLLGFLPFNYPGARIFLGDVGSQGIGLAVAALALLHWRAGAMNDGALDAALAGPLLLSGILYDVGFTLCRRLAAGERLLQAHRGHLYQVAFRTGTPAWQVTLVHWGFVLWGALLALALQAGTDVAAILAGVLLPQLGWTGWVIRRARLRPIGYW